MNHWIALVAACWLVGCAATGNGHVRNGAAPVAARAGCVNQTGSLIPQSGTSPCTGPGRSYSSTDIANTGQTAAAGALRMLDPTITITR